jgi:hypothetical protein
LILHQVCVAPGTEHLQLALQLWEVRQSGNQCRSGPQQTPLVAAVSTQPSSSSAAMDNDTAKEDGPLAPSNTKSQTRAVEVHRASSSASASHCAACSAQSQPTVSSSRSASWARPDGVPRIRLQSLVLGLSRHEHRSLPPKFDYHLIHNFHLEGFVG